MYPELQLASAFERGLAEIFSKYRREITRIEKVRNNRERLFQEIAIMARDWSRKKSYGDLISAYYCIRGDLWMAWVATLYLNINWNVKVPEYIAKNRDELEDPGSAYNPIPFKKAVSTSEIDDKGYSYVGLAYFSVTNAEYNDRLFQVYLSTRAPFGLVYDPAPEVLYFRPRDGGSLSYLSYDNIYALCDILRLALKQERHEIVRELLFRLKTILSHGDVPHTMSEMAHLRHFTPFLHWYDSWLQARFADDATRKVPMPKVDADPSTWTDPNKFDTDGDGYGDGPDVWVEYTYQYNGGTYHGRKIVAGEDHNANGKYDPAGKDGVLGNADDESDPNNASSHALLPDVTLATDENPYNWIPDEIEDCAKTFGEAEAEECGSDPDSVTASVWADAARALSGSSNPVQDYTAAFSSASVEDVASYKDDIQEVARRLDDGVRFVGGIGSDIWGKIYKTTCLESQVITDCATGGPVCEEIDPKGVPEGPPQVFPNDPDLIKYEATFINGQLQTKSDAEYDAWLLKGAYRIPLTLAYNPTTQNMGMDLEKDAVVWVENLIPYMNPEERRYSAQSLLKKWTEIANRGNEIVHFGYSQGTIITAAALRSFAHQHPEWFKDHLHLVHFANAYVFPPLHMPAKLDDNYLPDMIGRTLPDDCHFVYTSTDIVGNSVGGYNWFPTFDLGMRSKESLIANPPSNIPNIANSHLFHTPNDQNSYAWWVYYIGGPTFRLPQSGGSIEGERWWLKQDKPDWYKNKAEVQSLSPDEMIPVGCGLFGLGTLPTLTTIKVTDWYNRSIDNKKYYDPLSALVSAGKKY